MFTKQITQALGGLALVGAIGFSSCQVDELKEKLDGAVINVNTDILSPVLGIEAINALADQNDLRPNDATITISGPDAGEFYSTSGSKTITASEGLVNLAIKKSVDPTIENPLVIDVTITASGFAPRTQRLYVTSDESLQTALVALAPEGVIAADAAVADAAGSTDADMGTTTPLALEAEAERDVQMEVAAATRLFAADGTPVSGEAVLEVAFFDGSTESAYTTFPTSLEQARVKTQDGEMLEDQSLLLYGHYDAHLTVGGTEVSTLSTPMEVSMEIDADAPHPTEDRTVAAGDVLAVYSLDEATGVWQYETDALVSMENGALVADFEQAHFSKWGLFGFRPFSLIGFTAVTVNTGIMQSEPSPAYSWQLERADGRNSIVSYLAGGYYRFYNNEQIVLSPFARLFAGDNDLVVKVYEGSTACRGDVLATSAPFKLNGGNNAVSLSDLTVEGLRIDVAVSGICENAGSADFRILPSGTLYYKPETCPQYRVLGEVKNGTFSTRGGLQRDQTYDFMGFYDGTRYEYKGVVIESTSFDFNGETIRVAVNSDNVNIEYLDVPVPTEYCELFGG